MVCNKSRPRIAKGRKSLVIRIEPGIDHLSIVSKVSHMPIISKGAPFAAVTEPEFFFFFFFF